MPCVNKNDPLYTHRDERIFYCSLCLLDIFAYNRLDDEDFIDALGVVGESAVDFIRNTWKSGADFLTFWF